MSPRWEDLGIWNVGHVRIRHLLLYLSLLQDIKGNKCVNTDFQKSSDAPYQGPMRALRQ